MQRAVRAHVRDWLVARAEVPIARRRENDVARPWRGSDGGDLDDAVRIIGIDGGLVGAARVDASQVAAKAEWIARLPPIAEARSVSGDDGRAAIARPDFASVCFVRQEEQIDGGTRQQRSRQRLPAGSQRAPEGTMA